MLVFLHGFLGNKSDWDEVIKHLPHECVAFDLPGHGSSPIQFDLYKEMGKLGPFHLVGYSMGGRIALQYPGKILSLTLLSTHMGLKNEEERNNRLTLDEQIAKDILSIPIDQFLNDWYNQPLFETLRNKVDIFARRCKQDARGLAAALMKYSLGLQDDCWNRDCLRLIGELDEKYRTLYGKNSHKIIPGAGHALHLEKPERIAQEIHEYLLSI